MTRKEIVAITIEANPHFNRRQRMLTHATSPVAALIARRAVKKFQADMEYVIDQQIANTK